MFLRNKVLLICLIEIFDCQSCYKDSLNVKFTRKNNVRILPEFKDKGLIRSVQKESRLMCNAECSIDCTCYLTTMNGHICELYNITARDHLIEHQNHKEIVYLKDLKTTIAELNSRNGLQNYWPIDGSTIDIIGQMNMTIQLNGQLTTDRFGNPDSALRLSRGYASVPAAIYFDPATGGFTFMAWFKLITLNNNQRIFDFGLGNPQDNILLRNLDHDFSFSAFKGSKGVANFLQKHIELNEWYHIAVSVCGNNSTLYLDGVGQSVKSGIEYQAIERTKSYFGKSNWNSDALFDGILDDLKIFKRNLNDYEISLEMNSQDIYSHH